MATLNKYAEDEPERTSRALIALERFERAPEQHGEFLRGAIGKRVWLCPPPHIFFGTGDVAGFLVLTNEETCEAEVIEFLPANGGDSFEHLLRLAERRLGI